MQTVAHASRTEYLRHSPDGLRLHCNANSRTKHRHRRVEKGAHEILNSTLEGRQIGQVRLRRGNRRIAKQGRQLVVVTSTTSSAPERNQASSQTRKGFAAPKTGNWKLERKTAAQTDKTQTDTRKLLLQTYHVRHHPPPTPVPRLLRQTRFTYRLSSRSGN